MIRFAVWSAVSTPEQAKKISPSAQVDLCRAEAHKRGWLEAAGPYVAGGYSRTLWVNLRDAETAIPELHAMLEAAKRGEFDVLACYDYTRFRDLLDDVAKALSHYRVQLWSVAQPGEIQDPTAYSPYRDGGAVASRAIYKIQSAGEISATRNRYFIGMPARTRAGLPPSRLPYGYRKPPGQETNPKAVPIQDPARSAWVVKIKDLFLQGKSSPAIAAWLNDAGAPPAVSSKWNPSSVLGILANPFYAGIVSFGRMRYFLDPREGRSFARPSTDAVTAPGLHIPLWDEATHQAILAEFERRRRLSWKGPRRVHPLSGLAVCAFCGSRLNFNTNGNHSYPGRRVYRCKNSKRAIRKQHIVVSAETLHRDFSAELVRILRGGSDELEKHSPARQDDGRAGTQSALDELAEVRSLIEAGYEARAYPLDTFVQKTTSIDRQVATLRAELAESERSTLGRTEWRTVVEEISQDLDDFPTWLTTEEPALVNRLMHVLLFKVVVHYDRAPELVFRRGG
jgi:DNA invertase Pin-like site-specific DNA recombinase